MILSLWRLGWRLNRTMSLSMRCRSTTSPYLSSCAIFCRLPNFKNFFISLPRWSRKLAPGWTSGPFRISFLRKSMFALLTRSGYVKIMATWTGTATWSMRKFGSGEITVRPLKSTRFPLRFPLKRPCLPLSRWQKPLVNFFGLN